MNVLFYAFILIVYQCVAFLIAANVATGGDPKNANIATTFEFFVIIFIENIIFLSILEHI